MKTEDILERLRICLPRLAPALQADLTLQQMGLDSMETVELLCVVHEEFGVRLSEAEFQAHQPFRAVLDAIAHRSASTPNFAPQLTP